MQQWSDWPIERIVLLFSAVMYMGMWAQLTLLHSNARFRVGAMTWPVVLTPLTFMFAAIAVVSRSGWLGWTAAALLALSTLLGLIGLFFHLRGVQKLFGGFSIKNLAQGPPPILPLAYSLNGLLALIALLWGPES